LQDFPEYNSEHDQQERKEQQITERQPEAQASDEAAVLARLPVRACNHSQGDNPRYLVCIPTA
jgi:hypothetical protein